MTELARKPKARLCLNDFTFQQLNVNKNGKKRMAPTKLKRSKEMKTLIPARALKTHGLLKRVFKITIIFNKKLV